MSHAVKRSSPWAVVVLLFVLPALAVASVAYFTIEDDAPRGPAIAQGASGGAFHPVAGSFEPDDTTLEGCGGDYSCLQQAFGNVAYRQGAKRALALFEEQIPRNELVRKDCHRIAHTIGSAAFALYDGNVARTFSVGSSTCASGYYHGVLERAFVGVNTRTKLVDVARKLCVADEIRRGGFLDYQCRHGLGHGLMIQTGYDLPVALSTCGRLQTGWDEVACTGGVFMENVTTRFGYRSAWLEDDDPLYPCDAVPLRNRRSCYLRAAARVLALGGNDFAKAARTCGSLAPRWASACLRGFGREVVGKARYAPAKIVSLCRLAGTAQGDCLYGAARTVGDGTGARGTKRAAALCGGAPAAWRASCFGGVGVVVGLLYATDGARARACAELSGGYATACSRSAVAEVHPSGRQSWG